MGRESTTCSNCGVIIYYETGFISNRPLGDGLFGHICATCASEKEEQKRHRQRMDQEEQACREASDRSEVTKELMVEHAGRREEAAVASAERIAEEVEAAAYEYNNPGEYECPSCLYDTLLWGATRCPKCRGKVPDGMWEEKWRQLEAEEAARQAEWTRMAPVRKAEEVKKAAQELITAKNESWEETYRASVATLICGMIAFTGFMVIKRRFDPFRGSDSVAGELFRFFCIGAYLVSLVVLPVLFFVLLVRGAKFFIRLPLWTKTITLRTGHYTHLAANPLVHEHCPFDGDVPVLPKMIRGIIVWMAILGTFLVLANSWMNGSPVKTGESRTPGTQPLAAVPAADAEFYGERYPATRTRLLSQSDLKVMTKADVQYAINEMFARHGASFAKQEVRNQFERYSWYRPRAGDTWDSIEARFSFIEKSNLKILSKYRDAGARRN